MRGRMIKVALRDVIQRITGNEDRLTTSLEYYIGGEHYDSDELEIHRKGRIKDEDLGFKFHFPFEPGDVLFMARNPHLRKASRVDFRGICSDASYILRTKNESQLLQDFLPIIMQSDDFWSFFTKNKTGSVNPLLNWSTLSKYEFYLPPVEIQNTYCEVIWNLQKELNWLRERISLYDQLVKSRFIEMFGDPINNPKGWEKKKLRDLLLIERGGSPRPIDKFITEDKNGLNWIKIGDAKEGSYYIDSVKEKIKPEGLKKTREVEPGDLLLSNSMSFGKPYIMKIPGCIHDGWLVLHDSRNLFNKLFLCIALSHTSVTQTFKRLARGAVVNNLNKDLVGALDFIVPPRVLQDQFIDFVQQVDKSKVML